MQVIPVPIHTTSLPLAAPLAGRSPATIHPYAVAPQVEMNYDNVHLREMVMFQQATQSISLEL